MPETVTHSPRPVFTVEDGRPLRVAHLTTVDLSLATLLACELDVDVESGLETIGMSAPGHHVGRLEERGVTHVAVQSLRRSWSPRKDGAAAAELYAALRDVRPDVLHTHNPKTGVIGRIVGRVARVPVVVNTCHGLWATPQDSVAKRTLVYGAEAVAAAFSDAEMYQNATDRDTLRPWVAQANAQVVGSGTDLARFCSSSQARRKIRKQLGLSDDQLAVGGVGRLVREKGVGEFASMAHALRGRAAFFWMGPQDTDKADAVPPEAHDIRFLGERADPEAVYNALDVFVLPSYREGFSRSAMEAAATGLPMVLTDIRGCREIGEHRKEVLLVPPRNPGALTEAVRELLDTPTLRQQLGRSARLRALAAFDQRRVAATSLRTYAQAAQRRGLAWTYHEASP